LVSKGVAKNDEIKKTMNNRDKRLKCPFQAQIHGKIEGPACCNLLFDNPPRVYQRK